MSAWKYMATAARKEAVLRYRMDGMDVPAIAGILGATVDQVHRTLMLHPDPPAADEPPVERTPAPRAKAEKLPRPLAAKGEPRLFHTSMKQPKVDRLVAVKRPPAMKRAKKVAATAERLQEEARIPPRVNEVSILIHLPRDVLDVLQSVGKRLGYTRAQVATMFVKQAAKREKERT